MKLSYLATATAAVALLGGAASAQQPQPPQGPTAGSVTGDWNGAHAPSDEKQYQEKVVVPVGSMPAATSTAPMPMPSAEPASADTGASVTTTTTAAADTGAAANASYTTMTVTNGPVPDTAENRAKYGQPMSNAGKRTAARGN